MIFRNTTLSNRLQESYKVYKDVLERSAAGLKFYENHISKLREIDQEIDELAEKTEKSKNMKPIMQQQSNMPPLTVQGDLFN